RLALERGGETWRNCPYTSRYRVRAAESVNAFTSGTDFDALVRSRRSCRDDAVASVDEPAVLVADLGTGDWRGAVAELLVALAERGLEALLHHLLRELAGARRLMSARVVLGGEPLQRSRTHQLHSQVDDALVGRQEVGIDQREAVEQTLDLGL